MAKGGNDIERALIIHATMLVKQLDDTGLLCKNSSHARLLS
ncbi:hypothetical protein [Rickettsia endosymbiont of Orchestes rusci]